MMGVIDDLEVMFHDINWTRVHLRSVIPSVTIDVASNGDAEDAAAKDAQSVWLISPLYEE